MATYDSIIELSLLLKGLPLDFQINRFSGPEGGYTVTLHSMLDQICSDSVSGHGATFAQAYTAAINKMKRSALVNYVDEVCEREVQL